MPEAGHPDDVLFGVEAVNDSVERSVNYLSGAAVVKFEHQASTFGKLAIERDVSNNFSEVLDSPAQRELLCNP